MSKRFLLAGSMLFITAWILSFNTNKSISSATEKVNQLYLEDLNEFSRSVQHLVTTSEAATSPAHIPALREAILRARNQYKKTEFLAAYSDEELIVRFINGAPLPKIDPQDDAYIVILEPEGLQILDELIFGDEPLKEIESIRHKSHELLKNVRIFRRFQKNLPLNDREVFESFREQMIRLFTLGVTGFDTPLSGNTMPEALISFTSVHRAFKKYEPILSAKDQKLFQQIDALFVDGANYLTIHQDFDTFDRLTFLTDYINPIYSKLLDAQHLMGIQTKSQILDIEIPINYEARNLFDEHFLNKKYYVSYEAGEGVEERIELGKMLFFDPILSDNNERSCASCHQPEKAFTDGRAKSIAFNFEGEIKRNAPTLINSVFADRYFHDLRAERLDMQMEHVVYDAKEFNTDFPEIVSKLSQSKEYQQWFDQAFPRSIDNSITALNITQAIESYVATLTGFDSHFDQFVRGDIDTISTSIRNGFNIFMGKGACGTCHFAPNFNGSVPPRYLETESEVLGIPTTPDTIDVVLDPDRGRAASGVQKEASEIFLHSFKTPTVRNIALTAPYMHNGVYENLEQIMDFYNRGGGAGMGMDLPNQTLPFDNLNLNQKEIQDVISFMEALTDTTGLTSVPKELPSFPNTEWNKRVVGGKY